MALFPESREHRIVLLAEQYLPQRGRAEVSEAETRYAWMCASHINALAEQVREDEACRALRAADEARRLAEQDIPPEPPAPRRRTPRVARRGL